MLLNLKKPGLFVGKSSYGVKERIMRIDTSTAIMKDPVQVIHKISGFWDKISLGWKAIWGPHIHHGFYEDEKSTSSLVPEEKLIQKLASFLDLKPGQMLLDVGCGMGASSFYLAKHYQVMAVGVTISSVQLRMANKTIKAHPELKIMFKLDDAHMLSSVEKHSVDVVWSLESCEQFYDKPLFLEQVNRVLKPGGKLMLATWCSDQEFYEGIEAKAYLKICKAFDVPYMPTLAYYRELLKDHFEIEWELDWSSYVKKSWHLGLSRLKQYSVLQLLCLGGILGFQFVRNIKWIRDAFDSGKMRYGVFIAIKK
jgi:tocopherol O-methyltransferase